MRRQPGLTGEGVSVTRGELIERLEDACYVWRRMPDPEAAFRTAGERGSWVAVLLDYYEAYGLHKSTFRMPPPSGRQIDRAEEVLGWLTWLTKEHGRQVMRCVWLCCGERKRISTVCRMVGLHRNIVRKKRDFGLAVLVLHLAEAKRAA